MSHKSDLIATDIDAYLAEHERKDLLRFLTCGSVDDGKSTLIGRLLHDSNLIYADQLAALEADSAVMGTTGDQLDLALLMDGLKAEREQGITIDVAFRYFSTSRRKFIIADTPGHEQYTRNMVTGASTCQLAVILVDARKGVLPQTKRHSSIAALLGIHHVVVAVNKMDLVDWSQARFDEIVGDYAAVAERLGLEGVHYLPMSALTGDNVVQPSSRMPWYEGPPLLEHLETVDVQAGVELGRLRFPVQLALRPDRDFRGYAGTVVAGVLHPGDEVVALPSGVRTRIARVVTFDGDLEAAGPGRAVTVTLADEIDVSRGDLLVGPTDLPQRGHEIEAMVVWMAEAPLSPGRQYLLQTATATSNASVSAIRYLLDIDELAERPAKTLELNDIARCAIGIDRELLFDPYDEIPATGSFVLVDRVSNATVAAGMIIGRSSPWDRQPPESLVRQRSAISLEERTARFGQQPAAVLITGLTGADKSTIAAALERRLFDRGRATVRLDGENMRLGISRELGFSARDRSENLRRAAEVIRLVNDQGLIAIAALVAPEAGARERARELIGADRYVEVFLDPPIEVCRERDVAGLYARADAGRLHDFPGVSAPYDRPDDADLRLDTSQTSVEACVDAIVELLARRGILRG